MRYQNAAELCPPSCWRPCRAIWTAVICISPRRRSTAGVGERTRRKEETLARNRAIFRDYTAGLGVDELSARYFLAPKEHPADSHPGRRGLLEP